LHLKLNNTVLVFLVITALLVLWFAFLQ